MKNSSNARNVVIAGTIVLILTPATAWAYLDPGTSSFFIQVIIAGIIGALFTVKLFFHRVKAFFSRLFTRKVCS